MLIESKKPLVGHNPQYDLGFIYEKFIAPLPEDFIDFCAEWRKHFPLIYDTKAVNFEMSKDISRNRSTLEDLFKKVTTDKKYTNNLTIREDSAEHAAFGNY